jgi:Sugar (and other) transporter
MATVLSKSPWKSRVTRYRKSLLFPSQLYHNHSSFFFWRQASNWAFNTALAFAVPPGLNTIAWKTYFIFGSFNFAAFLQVYFMYPETVGRSLEEVEEIFGQGHTFTAWMIGKDVGKKTLKEVVEKSRDLPVIFVFKKNIYLSAVLTTTTY